MGWLSGMMGLSCSSWAGQEQQHLDTGLHFRRVVRQDLCSHEGALSDVVFPTVGSHHSTEDAAELPLCPAPFWSMPSILVRRMSFGKEGCSPSRLGHIVSSIARLLLFSLRDLSIWTYGCCESL